MGLQVGADVPFFFLEGAAIGTGIGERLKEVCASGALVCADLSQF